MTLDVIKEKKVPSLTCIPYGTYEIITTYSNRFKKLMPLLVDVPAFEGIRIHPLNWAIQTDGCIGVGKFAGEDFIGESQKAYIELYPILESAQKVEKVWIEIIKDPNMTRLVV
jgi:hypothetical protein